MSRLVLTPVSHWTIPTVSDHDAYLCRIKVASRQEGLSRILSVGTWNMSVAAAHHKPEALLHDLIEVANQCDVLCLQEAGAAERVVRQAASATGRRVWAGTGEPGQASTPVLVRGALGSQEYADRLTRRWWVGRGIGPTWAKPKWLMQVALPLCGRRVVIGNMHASLRLIQRIQFRRAARILSHRHGVALLAGDLNAVPGEDVLAPVRRHRMHSTQRRLGVLPTHGRRTLDDIYYEVKEAGRD